MTTLELISRLCEIAELQADIINKQAEIMSQHDIPDEIASEMTHLRMLAEKDLEELKRPT